MAVRLVIPAFRPLTMTRSAGLVPRRLSPVGSFFATYTLRHSSSSTSTSSPPTRQCPSCSASVPLAFSPCPSCSALLPLPSSLSHHSILHLSTPVLCSSPSPSSAEAQVLDVPAELASLPSHGYDLNPRDLRSRMLSRQRELHPDKFANSGEEMVELARELSGRVNKAYETLGDPLKRAEYILSVHELGPEESDSLTDPALLAEILEAREELEEATSAEEVDAIRKINHEKVEQTIASIRDAFNEEPSNFAGAKVLAVQLKYWQGLEAAAKEWSPKNNAIWLR